MNNAERKMLLVANSALNIPMTRNRMSTAGYTGYDAGMREILPLFNSFMLSITLEGVDAAKPDLQKLVKVSIGIYTACEIIPPKDLLEWSAPNKA